MNKLAVKFFVFSIICIVFSPVSLLSEETVGFQRQNPIPKVKPRIKTWKKQMIKYGSNSHNSLINKAEGFDPQLAATYYDAAWVYYQIADFTGDSSWKSKAKDALKIYRDEYVIKNNGYVPGYWNFSHGITRDYLETKDPNSLKALQLLVENAAYSRSDTNLKETKSPELSREVAYAIMTYLNAEKVGIYNIKRKKTFTKQALGHLEAWCIKENAEYVRPFMVGLTMQALISVAEINNTNKKKIRDRITHCANWLWEHTWQADSNAFSYTDRYTDHGGTEIAPDLNLLIAPAYAWLYKETGDTNYYYMACNIFNGGVKKAYLDNAKQFNQNYRWSFDLIRWLNLN